jgi:hypothetical protein
MLEITDKNLITFIKLATDYFNKIPSDKFYTGIGCPIQDSEFIALRYGETSFIVFKVDKTAEPAKCGKFLKPLDPYSYLNKGAKNV